jgi:hypothetical protein
MIKEICFLFMVTCAVSHSKLLNPTLTPIQNGAGVIFQPHASAIFSATAWLLVFEVPLTDLKEGMENINILHAQEQKLVSDSIAKKMKIANEYFDANQTIWKAKHQMQQDYNKFLMRIKGTIKNSKTQKRRTIRSIFPFMGYFYNFLYGSATDYDIQKLQNQVDQLFTRQDRLISIQKEQLTTFKQIENRLARQHQQLQQEVNFTSTLFDVVSRATTSADNQPIIHYLWQRELLTAIGEVREQIHLMQQTINRLQLGYLDLDLVPPEQLQTALATIQQNMPDHLRMVLGSEDEEIMKYYQLPLTRQLADDESIRGVISIPLANSGQLYDIYKAIPFPSHIQSGKGTERFSWDGEAQYVAVTPDHNRFLDLGAYFNTDVCIRNTPMICPAQHQASEAVHHNCLYQIMTGRVDVPHPDPDCHFRRDDNQKPAVQAVDDETWAISVAQPTSIQVSCLDRAHPSQPLKAKSDFKATQGHWLYLPRHCTATIGGKIIPLRLKIRSEVNITESRSLPVANTQQLLEMYGSSWNDSQTSSNFLAALKEAHDSIANQSKDGAEAMKQAIAKMAHQIEDIPERQSVDPNHAHKIYGTLWGLVCTGSTGYLIFWYYVKKRGCNGRYFVESKPKNIEVNTYCPYKLPRCSKHPNHVDLLGLCTKCTDDFRTEEKEAMAKAEKLKQSDHDIVELRMMHKLPMEPILEEEETLV